MTVGKDVSALFPDVANCMQTDNLELKKLVYLYLVSNIFDSARYSCHCPSICEIYRIDPYKSDKQMSDNKSKSTPKIN